MPFLDQILTVSEQREVLEQLFNFQVIETETEEFVILDDVGNEFNPNINGETYNLDTLDSIISYQSYRAKLEGKTEAQNEIKSVLGIT